jgi:hypothetical protein
VRVFPERISHRGTEAPRGHSPSKPNRENREHYDLQRAEQRDFGNGD